MLETPHNSSNFYLFALQEYMHLRSKTNRSHLVIINYLVLQQPDCISILGLGHASCLEIYMPIWATKREHKYIHTVCNITKMTITTKMFLFQTGTLLQHYVLQHYMQGISQSHMFHLCSILQKGAVALLRNLAATTMVAGTSVTAPHGSDSNRCPLGGD